MAASTSVAGGDAAVRCLFIGLGRMGYPMATRLTRDVTPARMMVHNRTATTAQRHADEQGTQAVADDDLAGAVEQADVVFTCLPDSAAVRLVIDRVSRSFRQGSVVVDCTSGDPYVSREIAESLSKRGVGFLDAPVSGGVTGATAGTLTTMVGGPAKVLQRVKPLLSTFAKNIVHAGDVPGSGHALKSINNIMNATHLMVAAEGLAALKKFGIQPSVALAAINGSSGRSMATEMRMPDHILTRNFGHGFYTSLMNKDVELGRQLVDATLPPEATILRTAAAEYDAAEKYVGGDTDYTEAVRYIEDKAGVVLVDDET